MTQADIARRIRLWQILRSAEPDDHPNLDGEAFEEYWCEGKGLARWSTLKTRKGRTRRLAALLTKYTPNGVKDPLHLAMHYHNVVFGDDS